MIDSVALSSYRVCGYGPGGTLVYRRVDLELAEAQQLAAQRARLNPNIEFSVRGPRGRRVDDGGRPRE